MNRRTAIAAWVPTAAVTAMLTGCAVSNQSQPDIIDGTRIAARPSPVSRPPTPTAELIQIYFVNTSNQVVPVTRPDPGDGLSAAITAVLAGPTNQESAAGTSTAIPAGTTLDAVRRSGSTAILDFSDSLASVSGREQLLAFAQIVMTADSLTDVDRVQISIAGQAVNAPEPNGTLAQGPVSKGDYASLVGP